MRLPLYKSGKLVLREKTVEPVHEFELNASKSCSSTT